MTSNSASRPGQRGLTALIPQRPDDSSPGQRAAAQMLALREVTLPAAVIAAAAELLAEKLDHESDPVTRKATAAVLARLHDAVDHVSPHPNHRR
ncbi:hypothetical protein GCM10010495_76670 [Kitasatospora herbaricolor]|uniref:hypothetical protein n=1 Tax=Kitasatospora herbaricolor TaxID=68217 RepID=UPI00174C5732|nr:hypothetical protein [Kitasatospora herbaricolor]MDQ0305518.1 hypothetical protein [Kitasatospora herbaricolor]GGV47644.1 hypothetical protein GCM10010495_76670 [Kitasatospora herbaricolor]